jgi:hypothetical protein
MTQNYFVISHKFNAQHINVYVHNKLLKETMTTTTEWQICWLRKSMQQGQYAEGFQCWIVSLLCIPQLQYKYIRCTSGIIANRRKAVPVHTIKEYMRGTVIVQFILTPGTRQKWVLNFPQLMLYPKGKKCNAHWIAGCVGHILWVEKNL